jgi:hypothetical protein
VRHAQAEEGLSIELQTTPETPVARAVDRGRADAEPPALD